MKLKFYFATKSVYTSVRSKGNLYQEGIYFITDTNEVYYHDVAYTGFVLPYTGDLPNAGMTQDHLYFNTSTLTGYRYNGTSWDVVVQPAAVGVLGQDQNGVTTWVSGQAVKTFVDGIFANAGSLTSAVTSITWDPTVDSQTGHVTGTKINFKRYADPTANVGTGLVVNQFATQIVRNPATGDIQILASDGTTVLSTINIPLDRHTVSGVYDDTEKAIVLTMSQGAPVKIYASSILNLFNQLDTNSVDITFSTSDGFNFISMDVKLSAQAGNELEIVTPGQGDDPSVGGFYINRAHLMDKVTAADQGKVIILDSEGNSVAVNRQIGAGSIPANAANHATTLVTEEALMNKKDDIEDFLGDTYVTKTSMANQYATFAAAMKTTVISSGS